MRRHALPSWLAWLTANTLLLTQNACSEEAAALEVPCAVRQVLAQSCVGCHQEPGKFGAPMPLLSYSHLHDKRGAVSLLELIAERVESDERPMPPPPNPALRVEDRQLLLDWLAAGGPAAKADERCSEPPVPSPVYADSSEEPADCERFYEFRAHGDDLDAPWPLPESLSHDGNRYMCFYFAAPWGDSDKAVWLRSLIDNQNALHHWILYGTDNLPAASGSSAPCSAVQAGSNFIAGWAPGGGDFLLPSDVEMDLPTGPNAGLILEVHYFKDMVGPAEDHSGVRLCTAAQGTREHLAGVHFTGSEAICVPPSNGQHVAGTCDPRDDRGDIHIIGAWPHMHKLGTHMKISVLRGDGAVETLHDAPFDFQSQLYHPFKPDEWVLHPGDRLTTECTFQNGSSRSVPFGERTQDEMCYGFIVAWPAGALENDPNDLLNLASGPFQQKRRCLNPLSILQSCNGLADFPETTR